MKIDRDDPAAMFDPTSERNERQTTLRRDDGMRHVVCENELDEYGEVAVTLPVWPLTRT